jgi:hypothetical protein
MNKIYKTISVGAMAISAIAAMAQTDIPVTVNGEPVHFNGQGPIMSGSRVLVPLRGVLERMGATVRWDPDNQTVSANKSGSDVKLHIGENTASVNGQPVTLDVPAQIINGSTMVPLRFIGEALGENVQWDAQQQMVAISTGGDYNFPHNDAMRHRDGDRGRPMAMDFPAVLNAGTVIPATLNVSLNSDDNVRGDRFSADVRGGARGLPSGTRIEGVVDRAVPKSGNRPGYLNLRFTRLLLPNGQSYPIQATFVTIGRGNEDWAHNAHFEAGTNFGVRLRTDLNLQR